MQGLIILGTAGSAYDVLDIVETINAGKPTWEVAGFLDDTKPEGSCHLGLPILGKLENAPRFQQYQFLNAIGSEKSYRNRPDFIKRTGLRPEQFATLRHPAACVSSRASLGRGVAVGAGVSVGGGVVVRDHAWLGPGSIVGHDNVIGEYTMLAPGATLSGFVTVGRACFIGTQAVVRQYVVIGEGALVGMGAAVLHDVAAGEVVVGNPAHPLVRSPQQPGKDKTVKVMGR